MNATDSSSDSSESLWPRPIPTIGDQTSAAQRAGSPDGWAFPAHARQALSEIIGARRDIRRYRPDSVPEQTLRTVLEAGHRAPSVGHSQPWRFIVVTKPEVRERAARMADEQRLRQAAQMTPDSARRLLDLQLEGIREAPYGIVVACDRRTPAAGVLGRATFPDADLWSCACAIQNMWLAARSEGLGMGWVTLFDPDELHGLLGIPDGVVTLGWLCLGWPDERPPEPGLERAGWSKRQPLDEVVLWDSWAESPSPSSHLRAPTPSEVVSARDEADRLLTPSGSLGVIDRYLDRWIAAEHPYPERQGLLVLAAGRHRVTEHGVSSYPDSVTDDVVDASKAGVSAAAAAAHATGLAFAFYDAGLATGDLATSDPLTTERAQFLLDEGRALGIDRGRQHALIAIGEVGVGNTTVASALAAHFLKQAASDVVGLGAGADAAMLERKRSVVESALARAQVGDAVEAVARLGGPEFAFLTGVILGAASEHAVVVLDGLATSVCALAALEIEPGIAAYLVAGQRSRERAHQAVLEHLGLEPILDLRLRAGEGVGAAMAARVLTDARRLRARIARTEDQE
ncbi:MAG TPA: 5,6-dimethylbenzimidazole synthase [Marmoricola sp.]|nr:5,6-dimethylbenzimidazole synthase [Marmoricola sp.]